MMRELLLVALPWALAWVATPLVARLATRLGWVDRPSARKAHAAPVPLLGGLALFGSAALGLGLWLGITPGAGDALRGPGSLAHLALPLALILGLGAIDDRYDLSPGAKLLGQVAIAVLCWGLGFQIAQIELPWGWAISGGAGVSLVLTVLWIVALTNAFNLIDGMDGLAAGLALVTTLTLFLLAVDPSTRIGALALCGALTGFMRYNLPPAKIFLGDAGAMGLGLAIAVFSITSFQKSSTAMVMAAPLLVAGVPLLDTLLAVARRVRGHVREEGARGLRPAHVARVLLRPDRGHIHHLLLRLGLSPDRVLFCLYALAGVFAGAALLIRHVDSALRWGIALGLLGVGLLAWPALERRVQERERAEAERRGGPTESLDAPAPRRSVG